MYRCGVYIGIDAMQSDYMNIYGSACNQTCSAFIHRDISATHLCYWDILDVYTCTCSELPRQNDKQDVDVCV